MISFVRSPYALFLMLNDCKYAYNLTCHIKYDAILSFNRNLKHNTFDVGNEKLNSLDISPISFHFSKSVNAQSSTFHCRCYGQQSFVKKKQEDEGSMRQLLPPFPGLRFIGNSFSKPLLKSVRFFTRSQVSFFSSGNLNETSSDKKSSIGELSVYGPSQPYSVESSDETDHIAASTNQLFYMMSKCVTATDILDAITNRSGGLAALCCVASIRQICLKVASQYKHNSFHFSALCKVIHENTKFNEMVATLKRDAKSLDNNALLTAASDLIFLRINVKNPTVSILLSAVDCCKLDLSDLRTMATCLQAWYFSYHAVEEVYKEGSKAAMRHLNDVTDFHTLLSLTRTFGRHFSLKAKHSAVKRISDLTDDVGVFPGGQVIALHLINAFSKMNLPAPYSLQQKIFNAINTSNKHFLPRDVFAVLLYILRFKCKPNSVTYITLNKIAWKLYEEFGKVPVSKLIRQIKILSIIRYYNKPFLERFVEAVKHDMDDLDFISLCNVLNILSQVYFLPQNAEKFFEDVHNKLIQTYPAFCNNNMTYTWQIVVLPAYCFSVFGKYEKDLISIATNHNEVDLYQSSFKDFLMSLFTSLRIEQPDLLPPNIPRIDREPYGMKLTLFQEDVHRALVSVVGQQRVAISKISHRSLVMFVVHQRADGSLRTIRSNTPASLLCKSNSVTAVALVPLSETSYCIGCRHIAGRTRRSLRLIKTLGFRVMIVSYFDWINSTFEQKAGLLTRKIFEQRTDDVIER